MNGKQLQGAVLMVSMLGILVVPGVIFNNLQNNGLIQPPGANGVYPMTCTSLDGGTCVLKAQVGCSAASSYCSLSGQTISFLNACSPFTAFVTFNFAAFVQSFFSNCGSPSQQNLTSVSASGTTPVATGTWTISSCQIFGYSGSSPPYPTTAITFATYFCYASSPVIPSQSGNVGTGGSWYVTMTIGGSNSYCLTGSWNGVIGNSTAGTTPTSTNVCIQGWVLPSGCTTASCPLTYDTSCSGLYSAGGQCVTYVSENSGCLVYGDYGGASPIYLIKTFDCTNLASGAQPPPPGSTSSPFFFTNFNLSALLSFALTIFGSILVIFLSLGLGFSIGGQVIASGGTLGFTNNPQGTKMAQTFGFAALIWLPLWSEFNTWFSSGYLPFGLDGIVGVVGVVLVAGFFIGAYLLSQSGTAGNQ